MTDRELDLEARRSMAAPGVIERGTLTAEQERRSAPALDRALDAGAAILAAGGSALDAVEAAVRVLEDDPHFNAGRGSVFTYEGTNELDAAIMDGRDRDAGAVTGVTATRNPISLARAVMEREPARLPQPRGRRPVLARAGARAGAARLVRDRRAAPPARRAASAPGDEHFDVELKYGTIGAVARRRGRPCRRRDLDRRPDRQELGPDRRFADDRRRHLCRRPRLRGLGDRRRRIFHPRRRRPRDLRADADARARAPQARGRRGDRRGRARSAAPAA